MEKEKVLEIEITKINEMYSCWYVKKVNKIKLKAMPLTEIGTEEKINCVLAAAIKQISIKNI